jgi:hypothetical protein
MRSAAASSVMTASATYSRVRFVAGSSVVAMRHLGVTREARESSGEAGGCLTARLYAHALNACAQNE